MPEFEDFDFDFDDDDWGKESVNISKMINFKKIKPIKFNDKIVIKNLKFLNYDTVCFIDNLNEINLKSDDEIDYHFWKFQQKYEAVPELLSLDSEVLKSNFIENLIKSLNIGHKSYRFNHYYNNKEVEMLSCVLVMDRLFFMFQNSSSYLIYPSEDLDIGDSPLNIFLGLIKNYKNPTNQKNKIYVVYQGSSGFKKKSFDVKHQNIDIKLNYNEGFEKVSKEIIEKLNNEDKNGLVILHGEPGTGKTTYLRYLASKLKRDIIFISPDMVDRITDPSFIPFLMNNSNAILILEDAEPALQSRDGMGRTGAVSNILNMTDGLLSDCLNLSIVATFNTNTKNIDSGLTRKGRLLKSYEFGKLSIDKAQKIIDKEKIKKVVTEPMTLADIYYSEDENTDNDFKPVRKIGFGK